MAMNGWNAQQAGSAFGQLNSGHQLGTFVYAPTIATYHINGVYDPLSESEFKSVNLMELTADYLDNLETSLSGAQTPNLRAEEQAAEYLRDGGGITQEQDDILRQKLQNLLKEIEKREQKRASKGGKST